jgi:hypothetical protein
MLIDHTPTEPEMRALLEAGAALGEAKPIKL